MDFEEFNAISKLLIRYLENKLDGDVVAARRYQRAGMRRVRIALARCPTPKLWNMLADFYAQTDKQVECYRKALRLDPHDVEACYGMASYELDWRERPRRALAWVERYMEHLQDEDYVEVLALDLAAELYREFGREKEARRCERRSKRLHAEYAKDQTTIADFLEDTPGEE